ncbi:Era-like GTP-binding protein [Thermococcus sp.]
MIKIVITGAENVGKSTLMNALVGARVSEVENLPGTTKGTIKRYFGKLRIPKGMKNPLGGADEFVLVDTAGLFDPRMELRGKVLSEERFKALIKEIASADIVIHMVDATVGLHRGMEKLHHLLKMRYGKPIIVVINKVDLVPRERVEELRRLIKKRLGQDAISLSLVTFEGFSELLERVVYMAQYSRGGA